MSIATVDAVAAQFERDGFVILENVFSSAELIRLFGRGQLMP